MTPYDEEPREALIQAPSREEAIEWAKRPYSPAARVRIPSTSRRSMRQSSRRRAPSLA